jgi:hypothetical protein
MLNNLVSGRAIFPLAESGALFQRVHLYRRQIVSTGLADDICRDGLLPGRIKILMSVKALTILRLEQS